MIGVVRKIKNRLRWACDSAACNRQAGQRAALRAKCAALLLTGVSAQAQPAFTAGSAPQITYTVPAPGAGGTTTFTVWIMDSDGSDPRPLTS